MELHTSALAGFRYYLILLIALPLLGCGGGGESAPVLNGPPQTNTPPPESILYVGLTDAEGDFLQYQVTVSSVALTRANGVVVETLPLATEFDFAQYTEVTEFLTAATVPPGKYISAALTLDYTDAVVQVEDANGDPVTATVLDENGAPAGSVTLTVEFADADGFVIAPGVPAHITLDFDLESSHQVNLALTPATATLNGVLLADLLLEDPKTRRARGLLETVSVDDKQFTLDLRPVFRRDGRFGILPVDVNEDTTYEINGITYPGLDGLLALANEPVNTPLVASGNLDIAARSFLATTVYAGTSVPFGDRDIATGTVTARTGNELTLRGAVLVRKDFNSRRVQQLTVLLSDLTAVTQVRSGFASYGPQDISVGQRITVHGDLQSDSGDRVVLNATEGRARLLFSQVHGMVSAAGPLVLELTSINCIRPRNFDFTGTGLAPAEDSDPAGYGINAATLPLSNLAIDEAVTVRGFVVPFGTAPDDFLAQSLGEVSVLPGPTSIAWEPGRAGGALVSADGSGMTIDISNAAHAGHLFFCTIPFDMQDAGDLWTLMPGSEGRGTYAIVTRDSRQVFTHFDEFIDTLLLQLGADQELARIRSTDIFDPANLISTSGRLVVFLR